MSGGGSLGDLSGGGGGPSSSDFGSGDTSGGGGGFSNPMGDFGGTGGSSSSGMFGSGDPTGSGFGDSGISGQSFGGGGSTNPAVDVGTQNDPSVVAPAAMNQGTAPNTSPGSGTQANVPLPRDRPASAPPRQPPQSDLSKIADLLLGKPQGLGGIATSNAMGDQGGTGGAQQPEDIPSMAAQIANPPLPQARPAGAPQAQQAQAGPGPGAAIDQAQNAQVAVPEAQPQQAAQAPGAASATPSPPDQQPDATPAAPAAPQQPIPEEGPQQPAATPAATPATAPVSAPATAPAGGQGQPGQGQQGGGQQGPQMAMKMVGAIVDLLTKGPMAFMQDLMGLAGQASGMGGQGGPLGGLLGALGGQGQGGMGGNPPPGTPMAPASWGTPPKGPQDPRWGKNPMNAGQSTATAPVSPQSPSDPGKNNDPNEAGITENERQNRQARRDRGETGGDTYDAQGNLVPGQPLGQQADPINFVAQNGAHSTLGGRPQPGANGLNPDFASRLAAAGQAYQQQTGQRPQYGEGYRDNATQQKYWNQLQGGRLGPVARPGQSLHNRGLAMDMPDGGFTRWLQQGNAQKFGLGFPVRNDSNHIQMQNLRGQQFPYQPQPLPAGQSRPPGSVPNTDQQYAKTTIQIESGGNPNARGAGANRGLGQYEPGDEKLYGLSAKDRNNPEAVSRALARENELNKPALTQALGREPTNADYYIAHQQGKSGGAALLANPNQPAWQTVQQFYGNPARAQRAIKGNIPSDSPLRNVPVSQITSKQFTDMWTQRFNRMSGQGGPQASAAAPTQLAMDTSQMRPSENVIDRRPEVPPKDFNDRFQDSDAAYRNRPDNTPAVEPEDEALRDSLYGKPTKDPSVPLPRKRPSGMTPAQRRRLLERQQDYETA